MTTASKAHILVVLASLAVIATAHAQEVKVRGKTVTADGAPIAGVAVQAFRQGEAGQPVRTDASGEYAVGLASGAPITRIEYRHSAFDLADIAFVSGSDSQQRIVKVMYLKGQPRSVGATADTLGAYEQFGLNAHIAPLAERQRLASVARQLELSSNLSRLPIKFGNAFVDGFLERRRKEIMIMLEQL
jgi:hypothetical protein